MAAWTAAPIRTAARRRYLQGAAAVALATVGPATPAPAAPSPGGEPAFGEREVNFASGADTLYGTLLAPGPRGTARRGPAALLLAGSGPTDRDGNSALLPGPINTLRFFASVLAEAGLASLRYDKLGTGKTGLASWTNNLAEVGFDVFVEEARAAYDFLRAQPEVDPARTLVLGHSEGGLIALVLAGQVQPVAPVRALALVAPLGAPYLDTIRRQLTAQYAAAQQLGAVTPEQAAAALAELDAIIGQLLETGELRATIATPALRLIFSPTNRRFLAQVARYDPAALAAGLPPSLPALLLRGAKDEQISGADVQRVLDGFREGGNGSASLIELPDVNHVFKEVPGVPNAAVDYMNPELRFSSAAADALAAFARAALA